MDALVLLMDGCAQQYSPMTLIKPTRLHIILAIIKGTAIVGFGFFAASAPGRTNDSCAFLKCHKLHKRLDTLEATQFFNVGDNAYVLCDELLIQFSGNNLSELHCA